MKHLKTYKVFESNNDGTGNASFDWLRKKNNEDYIELMHILQSEVFDDFGVISKSDESFGDIDPWEEGYPNHSFWAFRPKRQSSQQTTDDDFSDIILVEKCEVESIIVFNISSKFISRFIIFINMIKFENLLREMNLLETESVSEAKKLLQNTLNYLKDKKKILKIE